jgi:hypothetical protein
MNEKSPGTEPASLPSDHVLPYRDWKADAPVRRSFPWNVVAGSALGVGFGLPVVLASGLMGINAGYHPGASNLACPSIAALLFLGPLLLIARHIERRGRKGVLAGAAITAGVALLAAGACFIGNS